MALTKHALLNISEYFRHTSDAMDDFKITGRGQAKMTNNFKNAKQNLLKTNTTIYFNKVCITNKLTPKFIQN
jgi:hypothetical protein